nr:hypothetical protein [uncultured Carboxylicivirga sp.]
MGYYSDLDIEFRTQGKNPFIADVLGISYEELLLLNYKFSKTCNDTYCVEFDPESPTEILNKIDRLKEGNLAYIQPYELNTEQYYQVEYDSISNNINPFNKFQLELDNLLLLSNTLLEPKNLNDILNRQIFIGVIGTMESFLSEVFIATTMNNVNYFKKFIETHPEFKKQKFELRQIFMEKDKLEETAKKVMLETIYHNLPAIREMYKSTFEIEFPEISNVYKHVLTRHDLVHRNGLTKEGEKVKTDTQTLKQLIEDVTNFISSIADQLRMK